LIFAGHDVATAFDQGLEYEHNLKALQLAIVIVHVARNKVEFYRASRPSSWPQ